MMDMLTCAASSVTASSEHESSGDRPSTGAQILALKRKIIECDQELKGTHDRADALERALDMEKREHQLTTSKLTQLLKKRGVSVPSGGDSDEEIQRLRQTVCARPSHALSVAHARLTVSPSATAGDRAAASSNAVRGAGGRVATEARAGRRTVSASPLSTSPPRMQV